MIYKKAVVDGMTTFYRFIAVQALFSWIYPKKKQKIQYYRTTYDNTL